jgi:hypothetical protein
MNRFALLIAATFILGLMACSKGEDSFRIVPKGYEGLVIIIFDSNKSDTQDYEDGKRLYKIPDSGILITGFSENYGSQSPFYFEEDSNGKRQGIPFFSNFNYDKVNQTNIRCAFNEKIVGASKSRPAYKSFLVGKGKDIEKWTNKNNDLVEEALIKAGY